MPAAGRELGVVSAFGQVEDVPGPGHHPGRRELGTPMPSMCTAAPALDLRVTGRLPVRLGEAAGQLLGEAVGHQLGRARGGGSAADRPVAQHERGIARRRPEVFDGRARRDARVGAVGRIAEEAGDLLGALLASGRGGARRRAGLGRDDPGLQRVPYPHLDVRGEISRGHPGRERAQVLVQRQGQRLPRTR